MTQRPLFRSFWQAGFECSTHVTKTGRRLDLIASTGHALLVDRDYAGLREFGIKTVREGLRWHLIETEPGRFDFSSALRIIEAGQRQGIEIIWDLFHFGWPDGIDIFSPRWVNSFADFSAAFAKLLRKELSETPFIASVNEISFVSWAGGDTAYLNSVRQRTRSGTEAAIGAWRAIHASQAILTELPAARLVSPEPVIHIARRSQPSG